MKRYVSLFFFCTAVTAASAQISIQPIVPPAGLIQKNNLWNIAVVNTSGAALECRIELRLQDRTTGEPVLTATTAFFESAPGAKQVNAALLMPIQYNYISPSVTTRNDEFIPIGDYMACYKITAGKAIVAEDCVSFDVEPLSPPMLINPGDSSVLPASPAQFTWAPPSPMNLFSRLQYDMLVTEILPGQKAEEAIQQNLAFYTEANIPVNNLSYTGAATNFEKEKWYAWQITARDGYSYAAKSEVWVFKISEQTNNSIAEETPYTALRKNNNELAIAPDGILKISYKNEAADKNAVIRIHDGSSKANNATDKQFTVSLAPGENFIAYDLKKIMKPEENKVYTAELISSRNESYTLRFAVKYLNK